MKCLLQRVKEAKVEIDGQISGKIEKGILLFLGIAQDDDEKKIDIAIKKICGLRIFSDDNDKINLSIKDIDGELLIVSQFTLCADCKKGNRPSFSNAMPPEKAKKLYENFVKKAENEFLKVETGQFGADMQVSILNDGPFTILLDF